MKKLLVFVGLLFITTNIVSAQSECEEMPPSGLSPLEAYSIFQSNYKGQEYEFALTYGRWMMCAKPDAIEGYPGFKLGSQYNKFIKIYQTFAEDESDPSVKEAYLDTVITLFDNKMELHADDENEVYSIHQQKGRFYLANYSLIENGLANAYSEFYEMFKLDAEKTTEIADGYFLRVMLDDLVSKKRKEDAQEVIDEASKYASGELLDYINKKQVEILGSPEEQIAHYNCSEEGEGGLAAEPENLEILNACSAAYKQLDDRENQGRINHRIHKLEPTYDSASSLGEIEKSNANNTLAASLFKEALELAPNDEEKVKTYLNLSDVSISLGKLSEAKGYVQNAIKLSPNNGRAYIEMARIYGAVVSACTEDRKLEAADKVVYWVIIDYLNMAKAKDPSVANTVNNQLETYKAVTPSAEDRFLKLNYETGQKVKVDGSLMPCYSVINETTTVR